MDEQEPKKKKYPKYFRAAFLALATCHFNLWLQCWNASGSPYFKIPAALVSFISLGVCPYGVLHSFDPNCCLAKCEMALKALCVSLWLSANLFGSIYWWKWADDWRVSFTAAIVVSTITGAICRFFFGKLNPIFSPDEVNSVNGVKPTTSPRNLTSGEDKEDLEKNQLKEDLCVKTGEKSKSSKRD